MCDMLNVDVELYGLLLTQVERRDFSNEEGKEAELLAMEGSDDGMLAEVFADAPLM